MGKYIRKILFSGLCVPLILIPAFFATASFAAELLPTPTQHLRYLANVALSQNDNARARISLQEAVELAEEQENFYVKSNELRYIASLYAMIPDHDTARKVFSKAMQAACMIRTWNHRLYASIGVLEMQKQADDMKGLHENALRAIDSGLLEAVATTGKPAETGRFFTAMSGAISAAEREEIKERIQQIPAPDFQKIALHKLAAIDIRQD